jgi:hypothetical protein
VGSDSVGATIQDWYALKFAHISVCASLDMQEVALPIVSLSVTPCLCHDGRNVDVPTYGHIKHVMSRGILGLSLHRFARTRPATTPALRLMVFYMAIALDNDVCCDTMRGGSIMEYVERMLEGSETT